MGNFIKQFLAGAGLVATALMAGASDDYSHLDDAQRIALSKATEVWGPEPPAVDTQAGVPPSDAISLLGNSGLQAWESVNGGPASWTFRDGVLTVKAGAGDIRTVDEFCDIQLHIEWKTPTDVAGLEGQQRHNSGVFLQDRYEIQILDSYRNPTYPNGQAGSVYKQTSPLANAMRQPGQWQVYDIVYTAPRFDGDKLLSKGRVTVLHNGVVVQNQVEIQGTTEWIGPPKTVVHGCAPLRLQDHGNPVSFRNIWVRKL